MGTLICNKHKSARAIFRDVGLFWALATVFAPYIAAQSVPQFSNYPAAVYTGKIHTPDWIHHDPDGGWRDQADKMVSPPEPNFAGSYYIAIHSCGTGCRYHTITNLANGQTSSVLSVFDAGEKHPKTRDGFPYLTTLIFLPTSRMLIAQYHLEDPDADLPGTPLLINSEEVCRERAFMFKDEKLTPIAGTRNQCRKYKDEPE